MGLKARMRFATFLMITVVVILNTLIILLFISSSLKKNALLSIQSVNQQTLLTFNNVLDSFVNMSHYPLMDEEMNQIINRDYQSLPPNEIKFQKFKDQDTITSKLYSDMFYKNQYVYSVTLIPMNSDLIYSKQRIGKAAKYENIEQSQWYQKVLQTDGKTVVLIPKMEDDLYWQDKPIIALGRLLKNPVTDKKLGILRLDILVEDLGAIWNTDNLPNKSEVLVQDKDGKMIYNTLQDDAFVEEIPEIQSWMKNDKESSHYISFRGDEYMAIMTNSDKYGITVTTFVPKNVIYMDAYKTMIAIGLVGLTVIILAFIMTEVTTAQVMKPIKELNKLMKEVRKGNLSVRSKVETGGVGEFEEVCQSFNSMVEKTEELIHTIYEEQQEKRELEYSSLQAQISPHFTLNTVNAIKWMATVQGNKSIEQTLDALGNILTFAVREKDEKILISTELKQMDYYLTILSLRYYNKFDIQIDASPEVLTCVTLKYMLQTIVENSVFHGFEEKNERGKVKVKIYREGNEIHYEIWDNGKGMKPEVLEQALRQEKVNSKGRNKIGLYNINRRIKLIFGEDYGIILESKYDCYTLVKIVIPMEGKHDKDNDR